MTGFVSRIPTGKLLTAFGCRHTDIEAAVHRLLKRKK
jgi:hypothetical protein